MYGDQDLVKAIALALFIKTRTISSTIPHYTVNKLRTITGLSFATIKNRLNRLKDYGIITFVGKENNCLVVKSLCSKNRHKNFDISCINNDSVKEIEQSLRAMLVVGIQLHKDYARRVLRASSDGRTTAEIKDGRRNSRRYCYYGDYKENGLSYKGIARRLGVSVVTAFRTVSYALKHHFLTKIRHIEQVFVRGIGTFSSKIENFCQNCFSTRNNVYKVHANTYIVCARIKHGIY